MSKEHVSMQRNQVYLVDGKEVVLDDVRVKTHTEENGDKVREVSYLVREVVMDNGKLTVGPSFLVDKTQWIGRVILLPEAA